MFFGSQNAPSTDISSFAWSSLRRFLHTPSLTTLIMEMHNISKSQKNNVEKQSNQIRQCLIQAREYRDASASVSLATKPVLMYYSLLALSLAQILFNGDGMSSLDKARGRNAHHGLVFKVNEVDKRAYDLHTTAAALRAEPMMIGGKRQGTFELWCQQSREDPVVGKHHITNGNYGTVQNSLLLAGADTRYVFLEEAGMSLFDVFRGVPGLAKNDILQSEVIRGAVSFHDMGTERRIRMIAHPHSSSTALEALKEGLKFAPSCVEHINIFEGETGFSFEHIGLIADPHPMHLPSAASWSATELRFMPAKCQLNEFGYLYLGLYILEITQDIFRISGCQTLIRAAPSPRPRKHF